MDMSLNEILGGRREGDTTDTEEDDYADLVGGGSTGDDAAPSNVDVDPPLGPTPPHPVLPEPQEPQLEEGEVVTSVLVVV